MNDTSTLLRFLDSADEVVREAPVPADEREARQILAAVHQLGDDMMAGLHDQIVGCYGPLDPKGRCTHCGRLVVKVQTHKERGCLMAIPLVGSLLWLVDNPESIPYFGKKLWLRRSAAHTVPASGKPPRERGGDQ